MPTSKPILAAVATLCLLQGCVTPPPAEAPRAMKMEPLLQVRNSTDQNAATYYKLGKFHQERGNREAARAAYVQSIGLDRRQIEARNALAVLNSEDGKLDEAKALLTQLVQDYPRVAYLHNNLAYVNLLRDEPDAAMPALKNALALDPGNARALNNLGLVQTALIEKRNKLTAALGLADAVVGRNTESTEAAPARASQPATAAIATPVPAPLPAPAAAPILAASPIPHAPQSSRSAMEVVQVLPNVIELRQRQSVPAVVADRRQEKVEPTLRAIEPKARDTNPLPTKPLREATSRPRPFRFDVANGNGIPGMAGKLRRVLEQHGIPVGHLSNKKPYNTAVTEIRYRPEYVKEAEFVKRVLNVHVVMSAATDIPGNADVRLLLGKNADARLALLDAAQKLAWNDK